ncbi:MAG: MBL fold metallo-hydrolase [bacterium]
MKITFLGTGSSTGTPQLLCDCKVCKSTDFRNIRTRYSLMVESDNFSILVDAPFEIRTQLLKARIKHIDALWLTHAHSDHIAGIDDLRMFSFRNKAPLPLFVNPHTRELIESRFRYLVAENEYMSRPFFSFNPVESKDIFFKGSRLTPLSYNHGETVVSSFRVGDFAFVSDISDISPETKEKLKGLDVCVINSTVLHPHYKHMCLEEVISLSKELAPGRVYLSHMNHRYDYSEIKKRVPDFMEPAYDGMVVKCNSSFAHAK